MWRGDSDLRRYGGGEQWSRGIYLINLGGYSALIGCSSWIQRDPYTKEFEGKEC